MDHAAIEDLLAFTDYSWSAYEELIRPLGDELLTRPAPGSGWPALRDALSHINWAYVRWLASPSETTDTPAELAESWNELEDYRRRVRTHAREYLASLGDEELTLAR